METARELFVHEVNDLLDGERKILEALQEQEKEAQRSELKKILAQHYDQTEGQIERLEQVLEELGEDAESVVCHGVVGLIEEKHSLMEEEPSEELLDIINVAAGIKVEHYEIGSYQTVIRLGQQLGLRDAVRLLKQSLKEEQQALKKLEGLSKKLKPTQTGMQQTAKAGGGQRRGNARAGKRQRRAA